MCAAAHFLHGPVNLLHHSSHGSFSEEAGDWVSFFHFVSSPFYFPRYDFISFLFLFLWFQCGLRPNEKKRGLPTFPPFLLLSWKLSPYSKKKKKQTSKDAPIVFSVCWVRVSTFSLCSTMTSFPESRKTNPKTHTKPVHAHSRHEPLLFSFSCSFRIFCPASPSGVLLKAWAFGSGDNSKPKQKTKGSRSTISFFPLLFAKRRCTRRRKEVRSLSFRLLISLNICWQLKTESRQRRA